MPSKSVQTKPYEGQSRERPGSVKKYPYFNSRIICTILYKPRLTASTIRWEEHWSSVATAGFSTVRQFKSS